MFSNNVSRKVLVGFIILSLSGCKKEQSKQASYSPVVGVVEVKNESVPLEFEAAGKIYGFLDIQVRAQVNGILKERRFTEGQFVKKGESLFLIDPKPYEAALGRAEGALAQAESEKRRTERDFARMEKLYKSDAVSKKEYDDAMSAVERADANLKVARAGLKEAKINLGYTDVKAPISGYVRKECQTIGNLISTMGESSLLTSMVQLNPVKVEFAISGEFWRKTLQMATTGMATFPGVENLQVEIILPNGQKHPKKGKIIFVDNMEDLQTSTITIKAQIPNDDLSLTPGQFVRVKVTGSTYECPVVPNSCVLASPNGNIVYVIDSDKKASIRPVKIKLLGNKAVILEGLKAGETVVSEGLIKVRNGAPVTPVAKDKVDEQAKNSQAEKVANKANPEKKVN